MVDPTEDGSNARAFHEAIGRCLNKWQKVEERLFMISWLLGLHHGFGLASTFYNHVRAFNQKCALVDKLAAITLKGTPELAEWETLTKRIDKAGVKRDKLVHYSIEYADKKLRIQPPFHDVKHFTKSMASPKSDGIHYFGMEELDELAELFAQLTEDLLHFERRAVIVADKDQIFHIEKLLRQKGHLSNKESLLEALARLPKLEGE